MSPPPGTYNHLLRLGLIDRTAYYVGDDGHWNDEGATGPVLSDTFAGYSWCGRATRRRSSRRTGASFRTASKPATGSDCCSPPPPPDDASARRHRRLQHASCRTRAAGGHAAIQAYSELFAVVGSTADTLSWPGATDARDNTGTNYIDVDKGPPIYWLNGSKVADNYEDFYDGDLGRRGRTPRMRAGTTARSPWIRRAALHGLQQ